MQVYLVTGGTEGGGNGYLSSTELLVDGDGKWTLVGELPAATSGIRGVSFNNNIIMTGDNFILRYIFQILYHYQVDMVLCHILFYSLTPPPTPGCLWVT